MMIDRRGRLFGTVHVLDAAAAGFLLALAPLLYWSYGIRQAWWKPTIRGVQPEVVSYGYDKELRVLGKNLNRWMTVQVGDYQPRQVRYLSRDIVEIDLPSTIFIGRYDVRITDQHGVAVLIPGALEVVPGIQPGPMSQEGAPQRGTLVRVKVRGVVPGLWPQDIRHLQDVTSPPRPDTMALSHLESVLTAGGFAPRRLVKPRDPHVPESAIPCQSVSQDRSGSWWALVDVHLTASLDPVMPEGRFWYDGVLLQPGTPLRLAIEGMPLSFIVTAPPVAIHAMTGSGQAGG